VTLEDLERVAVTSGPGYYTGLRIGVSYACALAEAIGVPLVPLSTLEAMAYGQGDPGRILCPVLHARSGHLYAALFRQEGAGMTTLHAPTALSVPALVGLLKGLDDVLLLGEDAGRYPELASRPCRSLEGGVRGGMVALMGSDSSRAVLPPDRVRIDYLRAPDIGPMRLPGS
jgi:tRNA threonylcarbamoyladenosine biosynthesis protein TsaB